MRFFSYWRPGGETGHVVADTPIKAARYLLEAPQFLRGGQPGAGPFEYIAGDGTAQQVKMWELSYDVKLPRGQSKPGAYAKKVKRTANPAPRNNIGNLYARNPRPRLGTAKPKRASTATGKAPTKRLIARRTHNTRKGYFPNPQRAIKKRLRKIESTARYSGQYLVQEKSGAAWKTVGSASTLETASAYARMLARQSNRQMRVAKY